MTTLFGRTLIGCYFQIITITMYQPMRLRSKSVVNRDTLQFSKIQLSSLVKDCEINKIEAIHLQSLWKVISPLNPHYHGSFMMNPEQKQSGEPMESDV